jgi:hypothetical protein
VECPGRGDLWTEVGGLGSINNTCVVRAGGKNELYLVLKGGKGCTPQIIDNEGTQLNPIA